MKILLAAGLYPPDIGGPATFAKQLVDFLYEKQVEVVVVPFSTVTHLPPIIRHVQYFFKVFAKSHGAKYCIALDPVSVGVPAVLASRIRGIPMILRVGGDYAWEQGVQRFGVKETLDEFVQNKKTQYGWQVRLLWTIQAYVAKHAAFVVVPSDYLKTIVVAWGVKDSFVRRVYSSVAAGETPDRTVAREALHFKGEKIILSAGRFVSWKGFSALIEAASQVKEKFPGIVLVLAGSGPEEALLKIKGKEKLQDSIIFTGNLPKEKLAEYVAAADAFVLNTNYEGLSHQLLEVMYAGVPIITTPVGGNTELIENGTTGTLVAFNDVEALAAAIERVWSQTDKIKSMAAHAKVHSNQFLSQSSMEQWSGLLGVHDTVRVLMISTDANAFTETSAVRKRLQLQASTVEKLEVFIPGKHQEQFSQNLLIEGFPGNKIFAALRMIYRGWSKKYIDIVTAQDPFFVGLIGYCIAKRRGLPLQLQVHTNIFSEYFKNQHRVQYVISSYLLKRADTIRVVSVALQQALEVRHTTAAISVLPIFIDKEAIEASPMHDLSQLFPQFSNFIIVAARLEKEKNIEDILNALPDICEKFPDAGLLIAGEGTYKNELQKVSLKLGIAGHVVFLGARNDIFSLYKGADVVFAATAQYEGYGATAVEALCAGRPVVSVYDAGVVKEAGGSVVPKEALAQEIIRILHTKTQGMLQISLPTPQEWAKLWRKSLEKGRVEA